MVITHTFYWGAFRNRLNYSRATINDEFVSVRFLGEFAVWKAGNYAYVFYH
jgi:hypothetical protein